MNDATQSPPADRTVATPLTIARPPEREGPPATGAVPSVDRTRPHERRARRPMRRWLVLAVVAVIVAIGAYLLLRPRPVAVDTVRVTRGDLRTTIDEDGVTRVWPHATIAAPITGRLLEESVRAGDSVRRGQVVGAMLAAPLDVRTREGLMARVTGADALVAEAQANASAARVALDEAARNRRRTDQLAAAGAIPLREQEDAVALERTRRDALDAALERLRAARASATEARAAIADAAPDVAPDAAGGASRVPLRSPLGGRVLRVYEEHDRVVPAGTPILDVGNVRDLEVVVDVLSTDAAAIPIGAPMLLRIGATPLTTRARVARIEPAAFRKLSPLGVEEQRVYVHGTLLDPPTGLGDDYRVSVSIILWEGRDVIHVPSSTLVADQDGWRVYQLSNGRLHSRPVRVGHWGTRDVELLSGVHVGDTLVTYPSDRVGDGAPAVTTR